ncbi:hypothetical protein CGZ80_22575 [Rhodopirellula sp. MGV]|nr:hypothetical protein CGZ80_22575 [Rhodopirellula sp. MGV]
MPCHCDKWAGSRRFRDAISWCLPTGAFLFLPKCPACVAAYVALWTGVGISLTTAIVLRWLWIAFCIAAIAALIWARRSAIRKQAFRLILSIARRNSHAA